MKYIKNRISIDKKALVIPSLLLVIAMLVIPPAAVYSQAVDQGWSPPINVSKTGSASDPAIAVDSKGARYVVWVDPYNGFMYSKEGADGWTVPEAVRFPFSPVVAYNSTTEPVYPNVKLLGDPNGRIHAFWIDENGVLFQSSASEAGFGIGGAWQSKRAMTDSAIAFDAAMDADGSIHLAYIHNVDTYNYPAGIYYRKLTHSYYWTNPVSLSNSPYFRSITADTANVSVAATQGGDTAAVYVAYDNQPRNRISVIKSGDAGSTWTNPVIVDGPEVNGGQVLPKNVKVGASGSNAVLVWQVDEAGNNCTQNYKWSNDSGDTWQGPQRMMTNIQGCADTNQFLISADGAMLLMTKVLGQVYLHAWDGARWSDPQNQEILSSFIDQETYNLVSLNGQSAMMSAGNTLNVVGYDTGPGGDVWLVNRQIDSVDSWFSSPNEWTMPITVSTSSGDSFANGLVADQNGFVHMVWSQKGTNPDGGDSSGLEYARWDGRTWTSPLMVFGAPFTDVNPPSADISNNQLYVVFSDPSSGEIQFTSVSASSATDARAWSPLTALPIEGSGANSPQIHAASDGSLYVAYAVPINENRGIYLIHSTDGGASWSKPAQVFDAAKANWQVVDYPQLALSDPQHLYLLFTQYSLPGRDSPIGLYFTTSSDGGASWAAPQTVTNQPVYWSDILSTGPDSVQVAWQELTNGAYTVWQNTSGDGGQSWTGKSSLYNSGTRTMLSPLIVDQQERIHLVQSSKEDQGSITLTHWIWNAPQWSISDLSKFQTGGSSNVDALLGTTTSDGRLLVVYAIETPAVSNPNLLLSGVYSSQRNLDTGAQAAGAEAGAAANPSAVPTRQPSPVPTRVEATEPSLSAAPVSGNVQVPKSTPVSTGNQYIGLILGVAITVLIVIVITIFGVMSVKRRGLR